MMTKIKGTCLNGLHHQNLLLLRQNSGPPVHRAVGLVHSVLEC